MTNDLWASLVLVAGRSGMGKTSFAFRYLANEPCACRFVFDDRCYWSRPLQVFGGKSYLDILQIRQARDVDDLEASLLSQWCVYNPHTMFPGQPERAFDFFCTWVFDVAQRGPGKKIVLVDEPWQWCNPSQIPKPLANLIYTGRTSGVESVFCALRPQNMHGAIKDGVTQLVCFKTLDKALERLSEMGAEPDKVSALQPGQFVAYNLESGGSISGKVW